MESFTLSGQELFERFPEPVFWTAEGCLAYWNPAAERLCRVVGAELKEMGALPAFLAKVPEGDCLTECRLDGRGYQVQSCLVGGGRLYLLRPEEGKPSLSNGRVTDLMQRLRGPMGSMYAAMQSLSGGEEALEILNRNYCRLLRMVEEVEFAQTLDSGEFQPVVLDLAGLSRSVLRQIQGLARQYGPTLNYEEEAGSILVRGAEGQLRQLLYQLLSNAWRAAGPDGTVTVQLSRLGRRAVLTVSDTGHGMAAAAMAAAFDPDTAAGLTGLGLGIPICRRIAQLHGGTLVLESSEAGMRVTCSFPVVREGGNVLFTPPLRYQVDAGLPEVLVALSDVLPREAYASRDLE